MIDFEDDCCQDRRDCRLQPALAEFGFWREFDYRPPKMAVPTRMRVLPSSMAISKS